MPDIQTAEYTGPERRQDGMHSKMDMLRRAVEENTKATAGMSASVKNLALIPIAAIAMALASYLLWTSKISEGNWLAIFLVCLSSFFGDGVKRILEGMPFLGKRADIISKAAVVLFLLGSIVFIGCASRGGNLNEPLAFAIPPAPSSNK